MSERCLKIITTNKNNTCFVTFIFLEFLSCSLDVYFHQCVSAKLHRTKLGAFWLPAGGGLPRSALNGRRGWGAYQRYPGAFKRLHWTPSMMACACLIYSQIQNALLVPYSYTIWIFLLFIPCSPRTRTLNMHTLQTQKAPTHFCIERTLQMAFLHSFDSWPGSVSSSISAMQDLLKLKSSGSRSTVLHECGTLQPLIRWSNVTFFFVTAQRFRLSKDDGKSTFSEVPWPGHPENLKVRPREETERRNDHFRIRITRVSPSCVFHGNFNLQLIWAKWRKPLRRHKHTG